MDRMFIILLIWFAAIDDDVILDAMVDVCYVVGCAVIAGAGCCLNEYFSSYSLYWRNRYPFLYRIFNYLHTTPIYQLKYQLLNPIGN